MNMATILAVYAPCSDQRRQQVIKAALHTLEKPKRKIFDTCYFHLSHLVKKALPHRHVNSF